MGKQLDAVRLSPAGCMIFTSALFLLPLQWIVAWFVAVTVHELGHFVAVRLTGGKVISARVTWYGMVMDTYLLYRWQEVLSALAGPVASLLLVLGAKFFPRVALCGLTQGIYNLLPLYPLDGGRVLYQFLKTKRQRKIVQVALLGLFGVLSAFLAIRFSLGLLPCLCFVWLLFKSRSVKFPCKHGANRLQ